MVFTHATRVQLPDAEEFFFFEILQVTLIKKEFFFANGKIKKVTFFLYHNITQVGYKLLL